MLDGQERDLLVGTGQHDEIDGTKAADLLIGLAGDDTIDAGKGSDEIHGDFIGENLLQDTEDAISFDPIRRQRHLDGQRGCGGQQPNVAIRHDDGGRAIRDRL